MQQYFKKNLALVMMALLLTACAPKAEVGPAIPQPRQASANLLTVWYARGSYSIREAEQSKSGNYEWSQNGSRLNLRLYGPLYSGLVTVTATPARTILQEGKKQTTAADPEALLRQRLGINLPISGLRYWLQGAAEPDEPAKFSRAEDGKLRQLKQAGWSIEYLRYQEVAGRSLPGLIAASRGDLHIRISVNKWEWYR